MFCKQTFVETEILKTDHSEKHLVKRNNRFLKRLLEETSVFSAGKHFKLKKCLRCDKLITNSEYEKIHNFVTHYGERRYNIVENKPLVYKDISDIEGYENGCEKHHEYHDFYNSDKTVGEFLTNVKNWYCIFGDVSFKCSSSI